MRTASSAAVNTGRRKRSGEDFFTLSIGRIVRDVLLQEIKSNSEIRTIAIISPFRNDGKSELSDQISCAFAAQGSKTLLLNLQNIPSASYRIDPLKSGKLLEECIARVEKKGYDCLSLAEIGRNCGFTFDKASVVSLLSQLKGKYKRIVIDTEPLLEETSGFLAASASDGVYFICNRASMRTGQPEQYYRKLKEIGVNILGVIYNNAELKLVKKDQTNNKR
jgi:Mrp family chromosome partitioning ATPase